MRNLLAHIIRYLGYLLMFYGFLFLVGYVYRLFTAYQDFPFSWTYIITFFIGAGMVLLSHFIFPDVERDDEGDAKPKYM